MSPRSGRWTGLSAAAAVVIVGILGTAVVGTALGLFVAPQPIWIDLATYARHYSPMQAVPFLFGLVLLSGLVLFVAEACALAWEGHRARVFTASIFTAAGVALVGFNYALQLAYVPAALGGDPGLVPAFVMANPVSVFWALELFGYGAIGGAAWLLAPVFVGPSRAWIRRLLAMNGVMSLLGPAMAVVDLAWVMTPVGFAIYGAWNILMLVLMALVILDARRPASPPGAAATPGRAGEEVAGRLVQEPAPR